MVDWQSFISLDWPASGAKLYFARGQDGINIDIFQATWHLDCNGNGEDDSDDIQNGTSQDVNANDIPDECEDLEIFLRGDSNADGNVNVADGVSTLGFLFAGNQAPPCFDAADTDDSGQVNVADSIRTFNYLFAHGAAPAPPGPDACGEDPTDDALSCEAFTGC